MKSDPAGAEVFVKGYDGREMPGCRSAARQLRKRASHAGRRA